MLKIKKQGNTLRKITKHNMEKLICNAYAHGLQAAKAAYNKDHNNKYQRDAYPKLSQLKAGSSKPFKKLLREAFRTQINSYIPFSHKFSAKNLYDR